MAHTESSPGTAAAPPHPREVARLTALHAYGVMDSLPEAALDDITFLASYICATPIALISLVDEHRQWFKSRVGVDLEETSRDASFCAHAILDPGHVMIVPDATGDSRFAGNPLVTAEPNIRFYAGAPLTTPDGLPLGTLCAVDRVPRTLAPEQSRALAALSREVMMHLELRRTVSELEQALAAGLPAQPSQPPRSAEIDLTLERGLEEARRAAERSKMLLAEAMAPAEEAEERIRALVGRMRSLQQHATPEPPSFARSEVSRGR